ncbi:MAG: 50S ribosomal protein L10 [Patescibacteria group bacterium]
MALTRQQKEQAVQEVSEALPAATSVVFVGFSGLTVTDVTELRDKLYAAGGRMRVMPKRLLKIALKNAKLDYDPATYDGQMAVVWGTDAVTPAKIMYEFAKKKADALRLLAGVLEGNTLSLEEITSLAQLPSREQLLAQLVGVLASPARGLVQVLSGIPRSLVYVLHAVKENKEKA